MLLIRLSLAVAAASASHWPAVQLPVVESGFSSFLSSWDFISIALRRSRPGRRRVWRARSRPRFRSLGSALTTHVAPHCVNKFMRKSIATSISRRRSHTQTRTQSPCVWHASKYKRWLPANNHRHYANCCSPNIFTCFHLITTSCSGHI